MTAANQPVARDIVVVGASAGGVEALRAMVAGLPADLPAAVFVVLHLARSGFSALPHILQRSGPLPAMSAVHGAPLRRGQIYVAPADHHLLLGPAGIQLSRGPAENGLRPAVDPLFRSAARVFGSRVVGVVLSGTRDDGAAGLAAIAERGGMALVQDPGEALYRGMPASALALVPSAVPVPAGDLGKLIGQAAMAGPLAPFPEVAGSARTTAPTITGEPGATDAPPVFGCPTCHGGLYEIRDGGSIRYRCRVGHIWSPNSLLDAQDGTLEAALWLALRSLEDKIALAQRMAEASVARGSYLIAGRYRAKAGEAEAAAKLIADLIRRGTDADSTGDSALTGSVEPDNAE